MQIIEALQRFCALAASCSAGVALVSLLPFPASGDGAKVLGVLEERLSAKIGVFSVLVTGFVRGASAVLFVALMVLLAAQGLGLFG